jgi:polyphenol oxidase
MNPAETPPVLQLKPWQQHYPWLRHGFSLRAVGVSTVYGSPSLNLGWTKEDAPTAVAENRRRFVAALCGEDHPEAALVGVRQIHSATTHAITPEHGALEGKLVTADGKAVLEGDGLITDIPGVLIAVGTADCVPVFVVDINQRVVAAFHAGWRGTVERIVQQGITRMQSEYGSRTEDLVAAVGPSIGPCCYAIGDEVQTRLHANFRYADDLFHQVFGPDAQDAPKGQLPPTKIHLNLWEANRRQLLDAGLGLDRITIVGECTSCSTDSRGAKRFFSHRAEHGVTGRMLSAVGIRNGGPSQISL